MERIIAMSVVGAGPGNVFGPGMSAGALDSFVPSRQPGASDKAASASAAAEGTGHGATRPAEKRAAASAEEAAAASGRRAGGDGDGGARFDPARDGLLYCFETISPH